MRYLHISQNWEERLEQEGLANLDAALNYQGETLLSNKHRGRTWLHMTKNGQCLFIKQDTAAKLSVTIRNMLKLQRPLSPVEKEHGKLETLRSLGFSVPEAILLGAKRKFAILPDKAVMITLPVAGTSLDKIWSSATATQEEKLSAKNAALATLAQLWEKGCDWGIDCKPEHFFIDENANVSIIDVERMHFKKKPLPQARRTAQLERFNSLLIPVSNQNG